MRPAQLVLPLLIASVSAVAPAVALPPGRTDGQAPDGLRARVPVIADEVIEFRRKGGPLFGLPPEGFPEQAEPMLRSVWKPLYGPVRLLWQRTAARHYGYEGGRAGIRRAVGRMFEVLEPVGIIYFGSDVRALAADPRVRGFLEDLTGRSPNTGERLNLWTLALQHAGGDEAEAIRWLAVIFQDPEIEPFGCLFLVEDREVLELWIHANLLVQNAEPEWFELCPPDLGVPSETRLYHYYVPAYIAQRLRALGEPPQLAFLAPFVMNTEYERFTFEAGVMDGPQGGLDPFLLFRGPSKPFDRVDNTEEQRRETILDIYLGYRGALKGSGSKAQPADFDEVDRGLRQDPRRLVQRLVRAAGSGR